MNNEFPEFQKEMDQIQVPVAKLDSIIQETVQNHKHKMKPSKRKPILYSVSAAVVALGLFTGSAFVSPTMAKVASQIPIVGSIFKQYGDEGIRAAIDKELALEVNQYQKDNGITLGIEEVVYDGTRLVISFSHKALLAVSHIERPTIKIDGKEINFSMGVTSHYENPSTLKGYMNISPTEELPEEFKMDISFDSVGLIGGNWTFELPIKMPNEVKTIQPMITKEVDGTLVTIKSLKMGPAGTDVKIDMASDDPLFELDFSLLDEDGQSLTLLQSSGHGEDGIFTRNNLYAPVQSGSNKVTIIPYYFPKIVEQIPDKVTAPLERKKLPITLEQGEVGKIIIKDIEVNKDKMYVYFEVESDFPYDGHLKHNGIDLETSSGKKLVSTEKPYAQRVKDNLYMQEFETSKEDLVVTTFKYPKPVMLESIDIEIP
ncbi:DUF4179 domain-containing protein [Cytobacillus sp. FJAT-54145]|uniref:DUF4179 domain-containing protein n=1 Tax=Cytobacillus spartinae TaxID=3299023 RepID=A0ABW6KJN7_9BACI